MAAREQTGDCEFYRLILAYDNFTNLFREGVNGVGHPESSAGTLRFANDSMWRPTGNQIALEQGRDGSRDNIL